MSRPVNWMAASRYLAYGKVFLDTESIGKLQAVMLLGGVGVHHAASDDLELNVGVKVKFRVAFNSKQKFFSE